MIQATLHMALFGSLTIAGPGDGFITLEECDEAAVAEAEQNLRDAIAEAEEALASDDACWFIDEISESGRNGLSRLRRAQSAFMRELNDCEPAEDPFAVPAFDYTDEEWARFALLNEAADIRLDLICQCPPSELDGQPNLPFRHRLRCESYNAQCSERAEPLQCNTFVFAPPMARGVGSDGFCDEDIEHAIWTGIFNIFTGPWGYLIADELCT